MLSRRLEIKLSSRISTKETWHSEQLQAPLKPAMVISPFQESSLRLIGKSMWHPRPCFPISTLNPVSWRPEWLRIRTFWSSQTASSVSSQMRERTKASFFPSLVMEATVGEIAHRTSSVVPSATSQSRASAFRDSSRWVTHLWPQIFEQERLRRKSSFYMDPRNNQSS